MSSSTYDLNINSILPSGRYTSSFVDLNVIQKQRKSHTAYTSVRNALSTTRKKITTLTIVLLTGILAFFGTVQSAAPAQAFDPLGIVGWLEDSFCASESNYLDQGGPQVYGSGLPALGLGGGLISSGGDAGFYSGNRTAFEKYGTMGTYFTTYRADEGAVKKTNERLDIEREAGDNRTSAPCIQPVSMIGTGLANGIFDVTKMVVLFTTWFYGTVYQPSFVDSINDAVSQIITGTDTTSGLRDIVYFEFLNLILIFSALYLGWIGLVKRASMQAGQSAMWMFGAVMVGSLIMFNPSFLPSAANNLVAEVELAMMRGTTGVALGIANSNTTDNFCFVSGRQVDDALPVEPGRQSATIDRIKQQQAMSQRTQVIRSMECVIWSTFVYSPWVSGQFGVSPKEASADIKFANGMNESVSTVKFGADKNITNNFPLYQLDQQVLDRGAMGGSMTDENGNFSGGYNTSTAKDQKMENWFMVVSESMAGPNANEANAAYLGAWSGESSSMDRIGIALLSLVASIVGLSSILVISLSILMYSIAMALLMFISVLFLLAGAHPGMGRGIALRWAEMYVGTLFKRIIASALLGIIMSFYAVILSSPNLSYGTSVIAIIALSIAAISYRKSIMQAFTSFSFQGARSAGIEDSRGFDRFTGALGGAALGAGTTIASGSSIGAGKAAAGLAKSSGAGGFKQLTAAVGGTGKAAAAAAWKSGKTGAVSGKLTGTSAIFAAKSADMAANRVGSKFASKRDAMLAQTEKQRPILEAEAKEKAAVAEKAKLDAAYAKTPEGMAQAKRQAQQDAVDKKNAATQAARQRTRNYERDYRANQGNKEWREAFEDKYGMAPPNADTHGFSGYGMEVDDEDYQQYKPKPYSAEEREEIRKRYAEEMKAGTVDMPVSHAPNPEYRNATPAIQSRGDGKPVSRTSATPPAARRARANTSEDSKYTSTQDADVTPPSYAPKRPTGPVSRTNPTPASGNRAAAGSPAPAPVKKGDTPPSYAPQRPVVRSNSTPPKEGNGQLPSRPVKSASGNTNNVSTEDQKRRESAKINNSIKDLDKQITETQTKLTQSNDRKSVEVNRELLKSLRAERSALKNQSVNLKREQGR